MNRQRIIHFAFMVYDTRRCSTEALIAIVRARGRYSPQYRTAALRHLVMDAPLEVTGGRPFAERRRRVRQHYGI
jgi:hypothetical protein